MNRLREYALKVTGDSKVRQQLEDIFYKSIALTGNQLIRKEVNYQYDFHMMYLMSRSAIKRLNDIRELDDLYDSVYDILPDYGISQCYICVYDEPVLNVEGKDFEIPTSITGGLLYHNGIKQESTVFNTEGILPLQYIKQQERYDFICMALFNDTHQYGYIIASLDAVDLLLYETLRELISNTIRNTVLYRNRIASEKVLTETHDKLLLLSLHDELTGLLNRRGFYQRVEMLVGEAKTNKETFTLFFCDLDKFKDINDTYGHQTGDEAILATTEILRGLLGEDDILARMGGDEFIIILKNMTQKAKVLEKIKLIKDLFEQNTISMKRQYKLSISMGYCIYDHKQHNDVDDMIAVADKRMYGDKAYKRRKDDVQ
ncbi:MAG: GGDEF domain-containing protein [Vallitaleaceae bacterium]|nr:GGDEF domain-containing protein [Vallitaleaceae bacterium]